MLSRLGCFWILWSKWEEKRRLHGKLRYTKRQSDFWAKNANNRFLSKIWPYCTNVHLRFVELESGGQQLPIIKKHLSGNSFNLKKFSFFLIQSTKSTLIVMSDVRCLCLFLNVLKDETHSYTMISMRCIWESTFHVCNTPALVNDVIKRL